MFLLVFAFAWNTGLSFGVLFAFFFSLINKVVAFFFSLVIEVISMME